MSTTIKQAVEALKSRVADAYTAIVAKGGTLPSTQDSANLPTAIASIPTGGYTGHIDEVGLRAIGWNDSDIEWLQSKVDWMEEDDDMYKVPQELIDIYVANGGWNNTLLFAHKDKPYYRWSPRFDTTGINTDSKHLRHNGAAYCLGILNCYFNNINLYNMFTGCASLRFIQNHEASPEPIDNLFSLREYTCNVIKANMTVTSKNCYNLSKAIFYGTVDTTGCGSLVDVQLTKAYGTCNFSSSSLLSKESVLFAINNSDGNTATIKLEAGVLAKMQADPDVIAALSNFPNITLSA